MYVYLGLSKILPMKVVAVRNAGKHSLNAIRSIHNYRVLKVLRANHKLNTKMFSELN